MYYRPIYRQYKHLLLVFTLLSWIAFLFFELVARINNLYLIFPIIDLPSHFFAGVAISSTLARFLPQEKIYRAEKIIIIGLTFVISFLWELFEKVGEIFISDPEYLRDYLVWDGFFDMIFTVLGCIVTFYILERIRVKHC